MKLGKIKKNTSSCAKDVEEAIKKCDVSKEKRGYVSTGCILLNLALSDRIDGGFGMGKIANIIGDSSSGKTILALSVLAECAHNPEFDDYRLIYDEPEQACEFDISKLFGVKTVERIEPPAVDEEGVPVYSDTIQDFHAHIHRALDDERPFVYVLDSLDALDAEEDQKKAEEFIVAREKGKKAAGTYGTAKARSMSWILRHIVGRLKDTKSVLIIISQTRDNISPISFTPKTRAGGRALKFYSTHEIWLAVAGYIRKRDRKVGIQTKIKITKNKLTGKEEDSLIIPIYRTYGMDDIGASVDFLVREKYWKKKGKKIVAGELELEASREKLIKLIESGEGLKEKLDKVVEKVWYEIEKALDLKRRPKYC